MTTSLPAWRIEAQTKFTQCLQNRVADFENMLYQHLQSLYQNNDYMLMDSDHFKHVYKARVKDICRLIDPKSNYYQQAIHQQLLDKPTDELFKKVISMKPWEARPDVWSEIMQEHQRQISKLGQKAEATCSLFLCGKCGKKETTYYEMQSRSCDEPMTIYVTCVNCGNQWKQ